eukprot:360728-Chlamydomonas_euryale.AAC.3
MHMPDAAGSGGVRFQEGLRHKAGATLSHPQAILARLNGERSSVYSLTTRAREYTLSATLRPS